MSDNRPGTSVRRTIVAGRRSAPIALILALSFALRIAGSQYDAPYRFHPDEHHYIDRAAMMIREGSLNPGYFNNPPLFTYAILLSLYTAFGVRYLTGGVSSRTEFIATASASGLFEIARGLSALAGTATSLLLYLIGKRFGGELGGALSALFYAVAFLSVKDGHFATNDIPMVFLVTLSFFFAARLLEGARLRDLVLGGLTAGLAAATKYNGAIAIVPLLLASALDEKRRQEVSRLDQAKWIGRRWLGLSLLAAGGFLLGNPYAALDHRAFASGFTSTYGLRTSIWLGQSTGPVPLLALQALNIELGWPLLLLFPLAAVLCLRRGGLRARATGLALSVVVPLVGYHAAQALFFPRFLLPCIPFISLVCAWGLGALRELSRIPWARHAVALWLGVAILVASPLARSVYLDIILHRTDTRLLANEYLERVAPPGSLLIVRETDSLYAPPLNPRRYPVRFLKLHRSFLDPATATGDLYIFNSFDLGHVPGVSVDDERRLMTLLERLGFERVTFSPLRGGGDIWLERELDSRSYRHLLRYERPGPAIAIYGRPGSRLRSGPGGSPE